MAPRYGSAQPADARTDQRADDADAGGAGRAPGPPKDAVGARARRRDDSATATESTPLLSSSHGAKPPSECERKPLNEPKATRPSNAATSSSWWSVLFFSWCEYLTSCCAERALKMDDIWALDASNTAVVCTARLKAEIRRTQSLRRAFLSVNRGVLAASGVLTLGSFICEMATPIAVFKVVQAAGGDEMDSVMSPGTLWVVILLVARFLRSYLLEWADFILNYAVIRTVHPLHMLLLESILKSQAHRQMNEAMAQATNLFSIDAVHVGELVAVIHRLMAIIDRVSFVSSDALLSKDNNRGGADLESGALRPGGPPNVWSRECLGLLAQYSAIGLVYGTLPGTIYPFLAVYLNMEGTQTASARVLLSLPWSFKFIFGVLTDCFPIMGYRRRPPFWEHKRYADKYAGLSDEVLETMNANGTETGIIANLSARDEGGKFIFLMMLAAFGYIQAAVASDAVVCEFAQREPENVRGRTQTAIYTIRTIFVILSQVLSAFCFNGEDYGGDFLFTLSFPQLMLLLATAILPVLPMTWVFIPEERVEGVDFKQYLTDFWELLKTQAMYQVIAYKFFSNVFDGFLWVAADPVARYWIGVTNLNAKIAGIFGNAVFATALWGTGKYGLHWNWRYMTALTMIAIVVVDGFLTMLGVWGVIRSQWFWLGVPIIGTIPSGINFIVGT
ncbi:hypothetical protein ATCC90586_008942 [Pythium insidiosum]|nr:hypothetical protein ATCC90586_008942 [Pythium insidiosum]